MTFIVPINVLDTQSSFDQIFGLNPIMFKSILHSNWQCATKETEYLASKFLAF